MTLEEACPSYILAAEQRLSKNWSDRCAELLQHAYRLPETALYRARHHR